MNGYYCIELETNNSNRINKIKLICDKRRKTRRWPQKFFVSHYQKFLLFEFRDILTLIIAIWRGRLNRLGSSWPSHAKECKDPAKGEHNFLAYSLSDNPTYQFEVRKYANRW